MGGPWIILDHYVTVRKWQHDFKPAEAEEDSTAIWVRFPQLPISYYNEKVLYHIAKAIGKPLKIDINTAMAARGKYARVCIEMDLKKPLIPQVAIGKYNYVVEYEHIHTFCFHCGRVGHRKLLKPYQPNDVYPLVPVSVIISKKAFFFDSPFLLICFKLQTASGT